MSRTLPTNFFQALAKPPASQHPHDAFESLRGEGLVRLRTGEFVVTSYPEVRAILGEATFQKPALPAAPIRSVRTLFRMFLMLNAPDHPRLRKAMAPLFTPNAVAARTDRIRALTDELLGERHSVEVISELAYPLPLKLISRMLGVPIADEFAIADNGRTLTAALDAPMPMPPKAIPRFVGALATGNVRPVITLRAAHTITSYARKLIRADETPPEAEILLAIRDALAHGEMSEDEAVATWVLIVIAGHETTANLIGNSLHLLTSNPAQLDALKADRSLMPRAVDECLRLEGPVPLAARVATDRTTIGEHTYRPKDSVFIVLSAANRDPNTFANPAKLDLSVERPAHVAFGHGSHFCIGAQLAKLEASVRASALLDRGLTQVEATPTWRASFATRGLTALNVATE